MCEFLNTVGTSFENNLAEVLVVFIIGVLTVYFARKAANIAKKDLKYQITLKEEEIYAVYTEGIFNLLSRKDDEDIKSLETAHAHFSKAYSRAKFYKADQLAESIRGNAYKIGILIRYLKSKTQKDNFIKKNQNIIIAPSSIANEFFKDDFVNKFRNVIDKKTKNQKDCNCERT